MINDAVSDMIVRIANAYAVGKKTVSMPHTKILEAVAKVMEIEKYLTKVEVVIDEKTSHKTLKVTLAYKAGTPSITNIRRISKPGTRIYRSLHDFKPVLSGLGIAILSTPKGILSDRQARKDHVGGEVLAELW